MKQSKIFNLINIIKLTLLSFIAFFPELLLAANDGFSLGSKPSFVKDVSAEDVQSGAGEIMYWFGVFFVVIALFISSYIGYLAMTGKQEEAMERGKYLFIGMAVFLAAPAIVYGLFQVFSG